MVKITFFKNLRMNICFSLRKNNKDKKNISERKNKMKFGFLKGIIFGAAVGAAMGIAFDPISNRDKRRLKKKIGRTVDEIIR